MSDPVVTVVIGSDGVRINDRGIVSSFSNVTYLAETYARLQRRAGDQEQTINAIRKRLTEMEAIGASATQEQVTAEVRKIINGDVPF